VTALLLLTLLLLAILGVASPAGALDISPGSLTLQAGDQTNATVTSIPIASDGTPTCLEVASGTSIYLSAVFSQPCGGQAGWSTGMTVRTIPATPAGTYTIVFQVCPTPACTLGDGVRTVPPVETKSWIVQVNPAPVPIETTIAPPQFGSPAPSASPPTSPAASPTTAAPVASPTPSTPQPTTRHTTTSSPSPAPSHRATPVGEPATGPTTGSPPVTPGPGTASSPAAVAVGPSGIVLDHPVVAPGHTLKVSGTGCSSGAPTTVGIAGSVTGTTTAGGDGRFELILHVPTSVHAGRYPVVALCGPDLRTVVDVQATHPISSAALLAIAAVVMLGVGALVGRLTRPRRGA